MCLSPLYNENMYIPLSMHQRSPLDELSGTGQSKIIKYSAHLLAELP
jgi:hypothetical protein